MQASPGPRPFDVSARELIDRDPASWLAWAGLPPDGPVRPLDSEVSTVLAEVDKILRVDGPSPSIVHFEVQSSRDETLPLRVLVYHALVRQRHPLLPVASVVVLLRPIADGPELSGEQRWHDSTGELTVVLRHRVIRVWQRPVDELLSGGLGLVPLAPLAAVERAQLPAVIGRMAERIDREARPDEARQLWSAALLLMGLRYDNAEAREVIRQMNWLRDSTTYQAILEEGREEGLEQGREIGREIGREEGSAEGQLHEARRFLIRMATRKLGPPAAAAAATVEAIADVERIEQLGDRLLTASSWDELLAPDTAD